MGRDAAKSRGNVWRDARLHAAKYNEALYNRENVAEKLNLGVDAISRIETGTNKVMPVDSAVLLADLYNAPHLLNYYCLNECPIGCRKPISAESLEIDRITVKLLQNTKISKLEELKDKLLDIAEDGEITEDELDDFHEVMEYLNKVAKTLSEMKILSEKVLNGRRK